MSLKRKRSDANYRRARASLCSIAVIALLSICAKAQTFKVLYSFTGGSDGGGVWSSVVMDKQSNLYGTTSGGGAYGYGTVFELSPNSDGTWTEAVLHSFMLDDPDGSEPEGSLLLDAAGNLYGTTPNGGAYHGGTVFEMMPSVGAWTLSVLYDFGAYRTDAGSVFAGLIAGWNGNLYGTGHGGTVGGGAVFELTPTSGGWTESLPYSFGANRGLGGDGLNVKLTLDSRGNL